AVNAFRGGRNGPMSRQKVGRKGAPFAPPEDGLPNRITTMIVTSVPMAPSSFWSTEARRETARTVRAMIGHSGQNWWIGHPQANAPEMRSSSSPATSEKTNRSATRNGPVEVPVALISTVDDIYPAIRSASKTSAGITPNGSPDGGSLVVLPVRVAFCCIAAFVKFVVSGYP